MELGCTGEFGCDCPQYRNALRVRQKQNNNLRGHGTRSKYQKGCRCVVCRKANAKYQRERRSR